MTDKCEFDLKLLEIPYFKLDYFAWYVEADVTEAMNPDSKPKSSIFWFQQTFKNFRNWM